MIYSNEFAQISGKFSLNEKVLILPQSPLQHSANSEISLYISYKSTNAQKYFSDDFYIQFIPNLVLESEKA